MLTTAEKLTLRRDIDRRTGGMVGDWNNGQRPACRDVARFCQPRLSRFLTAAGPTGGNSNSASNDALNSKLLDSHGIWAAGILANGMASGMASPTIPWFKLTTEDPGLKEFQSVKEWLGQVEERLYGFFGKTNFYVAQKDGYNQLGLFGISGNVMAEHAFYKGVNYSMVAGEYFVATDDGLVVNTLLRRISMTCIQLVDRYGADGVPRSVKTAYDNSNYQSAFQCWQLIEPNNNRAWGKLDNINLPFRSIYWMGEDSDSILELSGYHERPFWAPRWDPAGTDVYSSSPAMNAVADLREIQLLKLRRAQAVDFTVKPPLVGPTSLANTHAALVPNGITYMPTVDKDNFRPIWQVDPRASGLIAEQMVEGRQAIDRNLFVPLFQAITNMPGVQPRTLEEVAKRNEEALRQLGPAIDRNQNEQLRVSIDRAFGILSRLGEIPPAPKELHGVELKVVFVGLLAQAQRAIGVSAIERGLGFVGNIAGIHPEALDKVDFDQAIDEYFDRIGAPPTIVRPDDKVAELRDQRAKQQQAMAAAQTAPAAMQQGADAAKLLSETDTGQGQTLLQRVMGG